MSRPKNIVLNTILILCSFIFTLLILEISVRIFFPVTKPRMIVKKTSPIEDESELIFGKPLLEGTFLSAEYTTEIKTNSLGFRDIEHRLTKPEDTFRILVAGDSFTFGLGVEAHQTYPKVLEKLLNEKSGDKKPKYEVFNMGIAGIGTLQELKIIKYGVRYKPDLILLGLFVENRWNPGNGNDLCDDFKSWHKSKDEKLIAQGSGSPPLRLKFTIVDYLNSLQRFLAKNSKLYFLLMTKKGTFLRRYLIKFRKDQNRSELTTSWEITKDTLKAINTFAREAGVQFVIVRIPFLFDVYNQEKDSVSEILAEFGKENNINICDPLATFRNNRNKDLYYPADGHWKPQAHILAAEEIFNYLLRKKIVTK